MSARDEGSGGGRPAVGAPRLAGLLREHQERILRDWEQAAREQPAGRRLERPQLVDHMPALLERIARVAEAGEPARAEGPLDEGADEHAAARLQAGFSLPDALAEYRLLRRSIHRVLWAQPQPPSPGELELLNEAVDQAMAEAARYYTSARQRTLGELEHISAAAARDPLNLGELLPRLLRVLPEAMAPVSLGVVFLREGNRLEAVAAAGEDADAARGLSVELGEGIAGRIGRERRPLTLRFASSDPVMDRGLLRGVHALHGVPLMHGDELLGVAYMASRTAFEFTEHDKAFFRAVIGRVNELLVQQQLIRREREAREETRRALALLDSLLAASPTGIAFFDRELRYVRVNDALAALNGRPVKEHLGRTLREVIPEVADYLEPLFRDILATGRAVTNQEIFAALPHRRDDVRWWIANYYPVLGEGGEVLGVSTVMMEVTARKRAEASLRDAEDRLRQLSEGLGEHAFFTLDPQGRVLSWTPGAERLYGYAAAEIRGEPFSRLYTPEEAASGKPERLLEKVSEAGVAEVACMRARKDGTRFQAHLTVSATRDPSGKLRGFACVTCVAAGRTPPPE